jgi:multiple sugar transport system substrate-binding protein
VWLPILERVARAGGRAALLLPLTEWQTPVALAFSRGAALLRDDDTRGDFRDDRVREAFAFYVDLFRRGLAHHDAATQLTNLYHDFAEGRFAVHPSGPWNLGEFARRLPADCDWATVPWPAFDPGRLGTSIAGGASLVVSRETEQPDLAWALVRHLTSAAGQCALWERSGDLPVGAAAWTACRIRDRDARSDAFWTQLASVQAPPKIPEWERVAARITRHLARVIRGEVELEPALVALDADVDATLAKRRWLREQGR